MTKDTQQNAFWWGKKHSASPHAFLPHPHAFCFVLFVIILVHSWDIKCCWPWTTFWNTWKIPPEKTLGFLSIWKSASWGVWFRFLKHPLLQRCLSNVHHNQIDIILDVYQIFTYSDIIMQGFISHRDNYLFFTWCLMKSVIYIWFLSIDLEISNPKE